MLFAETHGKLARDGSNAHDRAEDLLTSTAFQLLRYLPLEVGLFAVLRRVRAVDKDGRVTTALPSWLKLEGVTRAAYDPWPPWGAHGYPDMVVELFAGEDSIGRMVIEVKLDAGKSGSADNDDEETGEEVETAVADPDQLRKYWQGLQRHGTAALGVVYLTAHAVPPAEELATSVAREPGDWLGWLSWRDVWAAVRTRDELPARDLTAILAAKGLKGFDGFHAKPIALPPCGRFWTSAPVRWFARSPVSVPSISKFWEVTS
jgi:hypothetical protein